MPEHSWTDLNSSGLAHAHNGEWDEAASAFAAAMQLLSDDAPDQRAVVATNSAISLFEQGQIDEAIAHATAAHAVRTSMWGAASMACARSQADLAVMLAVAGQTEHARALIDASLGTVQSLATEDEHPQLVLLLENAARLAMMQGDYGSAEPLVLQLHALLDANGQTTSSADALFAMIAAARNAQREVVQLQADDSAEETAYAEIASAAVGLVETVDVEAVDVEAVDVEAVDVETVDVKTVDVEAVDIGTVDVKAVDVETVDVEAVDIEPAEVVEAVEFDALVAPIDVSLDMDLDLIEATPATLDFVPEHRLNVHRDDDALGFVVQHGVSVQPDAPGDESPDDLLTADIGPLPELAMPVHQDSEFAEPPRTLQQTPSLTLTRGVHVRRSARDIPVVMPSPAHSQAAIRDFDDPDSDAHPRNALHIPSAHAGVATEKPPVVLQDRPRIRASGGARVWLVVGGGLAAVAAAAGWYAIRANG